MNLRRLDLSKWADLTSRDPNGTRTWLDLPLLLPELSLPAFPPVPQPWPGDPASTRPGQFWRLLRGPDEWAWGGIYQILSLASNDHDLIVQRCSPSLLVLDAPARSRGPVTPLRLLLHVLHAT